jgi:hypothetical protein
MNIELSERPLTEIRIRMNDENVSEIAAWLKERTVFSDENDNERILLMPHPKHKVLDGLNIEEFLEGCPTSLALVIRGIYETRMKDRETRSSSSVTGFDLDNDFGFILVAFVT